MNHKYNPNGKCLRCGVTRSKKGDGERISYTVDGKKTSVRPECIIKTNVPRVENESSLRYADTYFR